MLKSQLAVKYAQAMFELAMEQNKLAAVDRQLAEVAALLRNHAEFKMMLLHPRVPGPAKKQTVLSLFGQEMDQDVLHFLYLIIDKRREAVLEGVLSEFKQLVNCYNNVVEAKLTTARPLSSQQTELIRRKLCAVTNKEVILIPKVDRSMIGGVVIQIGDKLIDGSIGRQLELLKNELLRMQVERTG